MAVGRARRRSRAWASVRVVLAGGCEKQLARRVRQWHLGVRKRAVSSCPISTGSYTMITFAENERSTSHVLHSIAEFMPCGEVGVCDFSLALTSSYAGYGRNSLPAPLIRLTGRAASGHSRVRAIAQPPLTAARNFGARLLTCRGCAASHSAQRLPFSAALPIELADHTRTVWI